MLLIFRFFFFFFFNFLCKQIHVPRILVDALFCWYYNRVTECFELIKQRNELVRSKRRWSPLCLEPVQSHLNQFVLFIVCVWLKRLDEKSPFEEIYVTLPLYFVEFVAFDEAIGNMLEFLFENIFMVIYPWSGLVIRVAQNAELKELSDAIWRLWVRPLDWITKPLLLQVVECIFPCLSVPLNILGVILKHTAKESRQHLRCVLSNTFLPWLFCDKADGCNVIPKVFDKI